MTKFWELFQQSVIMQSVLTVLIVGAWLYLVITGQNPPTQLNDLLGLVVGFFFGSKLGFAQGKAR